MDIEYHYYITYIIARRADFSPNQSNRIAYASQYTDDNNFSYKILGDNGTYENDISQTEDITKPKEEQLRIYPVFHFFPGTFNEIIEHYRKYPRRDGKLHIFNTVPGNENARKMMETALGTNDLYRVGMATHMLADTFAHQNFVGFKDECNAMKGFFEKLLPKIGHAEAKYQPDWPAYEWTDDRFIPQCAPVNNKTRFLDASKCIFEMYCAHTGKTNVEAAASDLNKELGQAIGETAKKNINKSKRLVAYKRLAGNEFRDHEKDKWFDDAIRYESDPHSIGTPNVEKLFYWKDQDNFQQTDWFQFQKAVKAHQKEAEKVLAPVFAMSQITEQPIW